MITADSRLIGFRSHLRAETVPAEAVYLISGRGVTALSGPSIEKLAPLLDGTRSLGQLAQELSPDVSAAEVTELVARLLEANLIGYRCTLSPGERHCAAEAFWHLAGLDADQAASALGAVAVEIVALGSIDAQAAAHACIASGLTLCELGSDAAAFSLVLCEDYLDPELDAVNAGHLASGRPWLLAKPTGADPWIGPVFRPGVGPCWACLAKRLEERRRSEFLVRRVLGARGPVRPPEASLAAGREAGLQIAVLEAAKWLAGFREDGQQAIFILDSLTLRGRHHTVARRPQCRSCGDAALVAARVRRPVLITSQTIATRGGGNGHRALRPAEMLEAYGHLVDPVTGIVGELRRDPRSPSFMHCYLSGANRAIAAGNLATMRAGLRARSGGKGATEVEAKVSALCEAVERYCGSRAGDEPTVRDSFRGLGARAVHPDTCQLFDERQFAGRARWNERCAYFDKVPERFDDQAVIDWTPVWSVLTNVQRLLPTALLYYDADPARQLASVRADSNGNAAGCSLEDAILQGFFELVERDSVALWWYNRTRQPLVDLDSFNDPWITELQQAYRRLRRQVWVLDLTSDLAIPAMAAISRRTDTAAEEITFGFGAHVDPHVALRRALTELGQLLSAAGADGIAYGPHDPHLVSWWTSATISNQPYLRPAPGRVVRATDYHYVPNMDLAGDIEHICALARRARLDILVLDQTRPDIGMPVVKVVVPGLRHFWRRLAPGRLFDVPVRLGRLAEQTAFGGLNPISAYA